MPKLFHRINSFAILAAYTLRIGFDDGTEHVIDFDPATLHDWPENRAAFIEMAVQWDSVVA